jgi:hypothetical protein
MTSYKKRTTRYLNLNIRVLKYCKHNELTRQDMIIITAFTIAIVVVVINNMTTAPTNPTTTPQNPLPPSSSSARAAHFKRDVAAHLAHTALFRIVSHTLNQCEV